MNNTISFFKTCLITAFLLVLQLALPAQNPVYPSLDTLPSALDSLPEYQIKDFARNLANQATELQYIFHQKGEHATTERENIGEQLAAVEADTLATKEERKLLSKALKAAKRAEKSALSDSKKVEKVVALAMQVAEMDSSDLRKNLPKAYKKVAAMIPKPVISEEAPISEVIGSAAVSDPVANENLEIKAEEIGEPKEEPTQEVEANPRRKKEKKEAPARPNIKVYDPANDVMFNPPQLPCVLTIDTRDAFSGEQQRELQKEELFRYTNPTLKSYYQDREQVICQAAMSAKGGVNILQLQFTINDVNAQRTFGSLPRNGVAIIKLLDGETLSLYNLRADEGKISEDKQSFQFNGQYVVEPGMFKKLQKTLLDKIRIAWSTGYEDYDIQNVDILERQLPCLLKK